MLPQSLAATQAGFGIWIPGFARHCGIRYLHFRQRAHASDIRLLEGRMVELRTDVLVLGAGMVGVGAALHLQKGGGGVVLVDGNNLAGEETSYGNSGIIECASVFPYMFPRDFGQILKYALNRAPQVQYRLADL